MVSVFTNDDSYQTYNNPMDVNYSAIYSCKAYRIWQIWKGDEVDMSLKTYCRSVWGRGGGRGGRSAKMSPTFVGYVYLSANVEWRQTCRRGVNLLKVT